MKYIQIIMISTLPFLVADTACVVHLLFILNLCIKYGKKIHLFNHKRGVTIIAIGQLCS